MKEANKKPSKHIKDAVRDFLIEQTVLKNMKENFEDVKKQFYKDMDSYFESQKMADNSSVVFEFPTLGGSALKVTRVQRTTVEFKVDKLEKVLPKDVAKKAIVKKYEVTNMQGLISYLKECNVDPKKFKSFLSVTKYVDTKEMDKLEELGKISIKQIKGCYAIKKSSPYYTVSEMK
jgi:hypothetical protein